MTAIKCWQEIFCCCFKEVQRKTGLSDLWNVIHKEEKATLEHTVRLHTRKTIYLNLSLISKFCHLYLICHFLHAHFFTFYRLPRYILSCKIFILLFSSLENDDMESSKRCVKLISLIFIIKNYELRLRFMSTLKYWKHCMGNTIVTPATKH